VDKAYRFFRLSNVAMRLEAGQIPGFVWTISRIRAFWKFI
jgi:hypothetical protein